MTIGIDASRAFVKNKTGIEEYSYQIIKHLRSYLRHEKVILYLDPRINKSELIDFELPGDWEIKFLRAPIFWTQIRLSVQMIFHPVDVLFIPAHTIPIIRPKKSFVVVHGLEYEFCPKAYSFFGKLYMRFVIKNSCRWAEKIISVSENTEKDLMKLYKVPVGKIKMIYNGIENKFKIQSSKFKTLESLRDENFLLFVGRLEERKNICGIIEAFEFLKSKYNVPYKLVLAGNFGYGAERIKNKIKGSKHEEDIIQVGYVSDEEKRALLRGAGVFLFPTFYEGFGLPIVEAQSVGVPVVTSNVSSMPEVAGDGAVLVDPKKSENIAEAAYKLMTDKEARDDIINKGHENVKRFSWDACAREVSKLLISNE
jgi:glycosyltransferase involved in cell wall biosynthesis